MNLGKFLMCVALGAFTVPSFALTNGGFESGGTGWSNFSCNPFTGNPGNRPGGGGTLTLLVQNPSGSGSIYQQETGVSSGTNWTVSGWLKVNVGGSAPGEFGWFGSASPYTAGPDNKVILQSATTWTQYTATQNMNSAVNAGYRDVQVNVGAGATYELDDFATQQNASVNDWSVY